MVFLSAVTMLWAARVGSGRRYLVQQESTTSGAVSMDTLWPGLTKRGFTPVRVLTTEPITSPVFSSLKGTRLPFSAGRSS